MFHVILRLFSNKDKVPTINQILRRRKDKKSESDPTIARKTFGVDAKVSLVNIEEEIDLEALDDPSENDELNFDEIFFRQLVWSQRTPKKTFWCHMHS